MFLSFQDPLEVPGISLESFIRSSLQQVTGDRVKLFAFQKALEEAMDILHMIARLEPNIIVAEPSELIGTGCTSGPEYVAAAAKSVKDVNPGILVLTAAGIACGEDVYNTILAGADATGSSSGVAKAKDRAAMDSGTVLITKDNAATYEDDLWAAVKVKGTSW